MLSKPHVSTQEVEIVKAEAKEDVHTWARERHPSQIPIFYGHNCRKGEIALEFYSPSDLLILSEDSFSLLLTIRDYQDSRTLEFLFE